jgi:hypothetical protein
MFGDLSPLIGSVSVSTESQKQYDLDAIAIEALA